VRPPAEYLGAEGVPGVELHDRLVRDAQLSCGECGTQLGLQLDPLPQLIAPARAPNGDDAGAFSLRQVHRDVRLA
jgi:hypothetical protein